MHEGIPDTIVVDIRGHEIGGRSGVRQNAGTQSPELNYSSVPLDLMIFWYAKKLSLRRRS